MTLRTTITRKIEFDAGHRIPNHASKCRNVHGHRYVLEATLSGPIISSGSQEGMVSDFGIVKEIMMLKVGEPWDHAFLCWVDDTQILKMLEDIPNHKTVLFAVVPTVENLVRQAFIAMKSSFENAGITLDRTRLYETPNCWADYQE